MSELAIFLPGLLSSVREHRCRAAEYRKHDEQRRQGAGGVAAAKECGAANRVKVLAALKSFGGQPEQISVIAAKAGLGYNSTNTHLLALVKEGAADRTPGKRGLFLIVDREARRA